ncbi:MAG: IPT/TIG domain-containing protein, partial [Acidobacteria bacterium]|nr:IPT/TIG domain-containing protein [Acidobacteriota bacterium]
NYSATRSISTPTGGSWFSIGPDSGSNGGLLTLTFNTAGLAAGSYSGSIALNSSEAHNSPIVIPVTLNMVASNPLISVDKNALSFMTAVGSNPASQTVAISNAGSGALAWSASATSTGGWLSVAPASGTGSGTITVSAAAASLTAGTHTGVLTITGSGSANTVGIPVVLRVGPAVTGPYTISTIAGQGAIAENGVATAQPLSSMFGVAVDSAGNTYVASFTRNKVFKITPSGAVSTFAGTGQPGAEGDQGAGGDGGPAALAHLSNPQGVAVDSAGNVYITEVNGRRVRKVDTNGIITTVAGNGDAGYSGDGGPATMARLTVPRAVALDSNGNFYIAGSDVDTHVRKVTPSGTITTVAGTGTPGFSGDSGPATSAQIGTFVRGLAVDASGNLYIADQSNHRIRKVDVNGTITTVAGTGIGGFSGDGGAATSARLRNPTWVSVDGSGNLYIADRGNNRVRKVSGGTIATIAGTGTVGSSGDGGSALSAVLVPYAVALDGAGNLYISDTAGNRIRKVTASTGNIQTVAGGVTPGFGGDGLAAASSVLASPQAAAIDLHGNLYIADTANHRVRMIRASDRIIQTIAGTGVAGFAGDGGQATAAQLSSPRGIAVSPLGDIFIADLGNVRIRKIRPDGVITTVAGSGTSGFAGDGGPATAAALNAPNWIAVDANGNLYIGDSTTHRIRRVAPDGIINTIAGTGIAGFSGDGGPAILARLSNPGAIAVDSAGSVFVVDTNNVRVRKIAVDGAISTVAGNGGAGDEGDRGPATAAQLLFPAGVATDPGGNMYVSDLNSVRKIAPDGIIDRIAGTRLAFGFSGDGGPALDAALNLIGGIAADVRGPLVVVDADTAVIRKLTPVPAGSATLRVEPVTGYSIRCTANPREQGEIFIELQGTGTFTWSATISLRNGSNWLRLGQTSGSGSTLVQAEVDATGLTPGIYSGTVTVTSPQAVNGSVVVPVTLVVHAACNPKPVLASVAPASVNAGAGDTTITLTGSNFIAGSFVESVFPGGSTVSFPTAYVSSTEIKAVIPASNLSFNRTLALSVTNPLPGGGTSVELPFRIGNSPVITGLSPSSGRAGTTIPATITGLGFTGATAVTFTGSGVTATIGSGATGTSLPITITIAAGASIGLRDLTVTTTSFNESNRYRFTVQSCPLITSITPGAAEPPASGNKTISATISGCGLTGATAVAFSGSGITAAIGSGGTDTSLPITITIASTAELTARNVTVNIGDTATPAFQSFTVLPPGSQPVISELNATPPGLSQTAAPLYGKQFTLTVNGQKFDQGANVFIGATALATTFVSATQLTAAVPMAVLASATTSAVFVMNPNGGVSNSHTMRIVERGDINANRNINIGDALVTALTVGGVVKPSLPVTVGDMNLNAAVNIGDALVLALFAGRVNVNLASPAVTSVSANPAGRGQSLTITGIGFSAAAADNQVLFTTTDDGVVRVTPSASTTTSLTVTVPSDAVSGPLQVYRTDVPIGGQEYPLTVSGTAARLALTTLAPLTPVAAGSDITLSGIGFSTTASSNTITFKAATGTTTGTVKSATSTSLTVTVPTGAVCGPVTVTVGTETSNARTAQISGSTCALQLNDILGGGSPGDTLVLEGAGFNVSSPSANLVKFAAAGGATVNAKVLQAGGTQLHVRIPDGAVEGNVTVTVGSQNSNAVTYRAPALMIPASIDVVITSSVGVGLYQVTISFDKNVVQLQSANVKGGTGAGFAQAPTTINIDNSAGTVTLNAFQTSSAPTGTFTIANLTFTPVAVGTSNLTISNITLTNTNGDNLPATGMSLSSNTITVLRVP